MVPSHADHAQYGVARLVQQRQCRRCFGDAEAAVSHRLGYRLHTATHDAAVCAYMRCGAATRQKRRLTISYAVPGIPAAEHVTIGWLQRSTETLFSLLGSLGQIAQRILSRPPCSQQSQGCLLFVFLLLSSYLVVSLLNTTSVSSQRGKIVTCDNMSPF